MDIKETCYEVAKHKFNIRMPQSENLWHSLAPYQPFETTPSTDPLFTLELDDNLQSMEEEAKLVEKFDSDTSCINLYKTKDDDFFFQIAIPGQVVSCNLWIKKDFKLAKASLLGNDKVRSFGLNNCLMLLYAFASAPHDTLLIHASVINNGERAFAFLGVSGTGKSTHSKLWLQYIPNSELLNDDNPAIRIVDGIPLIFGTPWSGSTPCYKNDVANLGGIIKLQQAPHNKIEQLSLVKAYAVLLPACSNMKWEKELMDGIHATLQKLVHTTPSFHLECLPNKAAAELSAKSLKVSSDEENSTQSNYI